MKIRDIFESSFAIELAKDLAEKQETLPPQKIIRKLIRFAAIGGVSLLVTIAAVLVIVSSIGDDANTRQVLVFLSFVSLLVLVSAIGATLVTLWDGFVGQYIQRLSLMDVELEENEADIVYEIPVVNMPLPEPAIAFEDLEQVSNVMVSIEDGQFVHDGDMSMAVVAQKLEGFRGVLSPEDWTNSGFQDHINYFDGLGADVTVERNLSVSGLNVLATAMPMISSPLLVSHYEMTGQIANMLVDLKQSIESEEEANAAPEANQAVAG